MDGDINNQDAGGRLNRRPKYLMAKAAGPKLATEIDSLNK
jgi:hypothetical protein